MDRWEYIENVCKAWAFESLEGAVKQMTLPCSPNFKVDVLRILSQIFLEQAEQSSLNPTVKESQDF